MKRILILSNHSFMLWQFRRELIQTMLQSGMEVTLGVPFGDHIEDFRALGCKLIDIPVDRRGINPFRDLHLSRQYRDLLKTQKPDMVVTYSIKPNIYGGFACRLLKIPYCVNITGLGTAFQSPAISRIVTVMYRTALKRPRPYSLKMPETRNSSWKGKSPPPPSRCCFPVPASICSTTPSSLIPKTIPSGSCSWAG